MTAVAAGPTGAAVVEQESLHPTHEHGRFSSVFGGFQDQRRSSQSDRSSYHDHAIA